MPKVDHTINKLDQSECIRLLEALVKNKNFRNANQHLSDPQVEDLKRGIFPQKDYVFCPIRLSVLESFRQAEESGHLPLPATSLNGQKVDWHHVASKASNAKFRLGGYQQLCKTIHFNDEALEAYNINPNHHSIERIGKGDQIRASICPTIHKAMRDVSRKQMGIDLQDEDHWRDEMWKDFWVQWSACHLMHGGPDCQWADERDDYASFVDANIIAYGPPAKGQGRKKRSKKGHSSRRQMINDLDQAHLEEMMDDVFLDDLFVQVNPHLTLDEVESIRKNREFPAKKPVFAIQRDNDPATDEGLPRYSIQDNSGRQTDPVYAREVTTRLINPDVMVGNKDRCSRLLDIRGDRILTRLNINPRMLLWEDVKDAKRRRFCAILRYGVEKEYCALMHVRWSDQHTDWIGKGWDEFKALYNKCEILHSGPRCLFWSDMEGIELVDPSVFAGYRHGKGEK